MVVVVVVVTTTIHDKEHKQFECSHDEKKKIKLRRK
jgi:hypothetical protein